MAAEEDAFVARDPAALERTYRAHSTLLYSIARQVLGNDDDAMDCVHDALVRVWRRPNAFRAERGTLRVYLAACYVSSEPNSPRSAADVRTRNERYDRSARGRSIELFALGVLERDEAEFVANHAATCGRCARRIGIAEAAVIALAEETVATVFAPAELGSRIRASARETAPATQRRISLLAYAALAAALLFAVGTIFEVRAIFDMRHAAAQNDVALVALVNSHFTHQTFAKLVPTAPAAKVLLGRSPHWLYVIVDSPACAISANRFRTSVRRRFSYRTSPTFPKSIFATARAP